MIPPKLKNRLNIIVFGTDTKEGRLFDIVFLWSILLSVLGVMVESIREIREEYVNFFFVSEWFFTILFSVEYLLRLLVSYHPKKYFLSFFGIIDLLAILPTFLAMISTGGSYMMVIRTVRLLRVFRILKLGRYIKEASVLVDALKASRHKILIFSGAVFSVAVIMGTVMYLIENVEDGFTSIPRSIYWAIVTITTVGYGDISPQTALGQTIAALLMLVGYSIIAVPTGIVTSELVNQKSSKNDNEDSQETVICPKCAFESQDVDPSYCSNCGYYFSG